jgi:hypothetical protein
MTGHPDADPDTLVRTGTPQIEFEQAFRLDRRPRGITLPWLRDGLAGLVEVVADLIRGGGPQSPAAEG